VEIFLASNFPFLGGGWSSDRRAEIWAWLFWFVGIVAHLLEILIDIPESIQAPVHIIGQLSYLGVAILHIQILRGCSSSWRRKGLWIVMIPVMAITTITAGFMFDLIRLVFMLGMIYIGVRRRIPWGVALGSAAFILPLLAFKQAYRLLTLVDGKVVFDSIASIGDNALTFFSASMNTIRSADKEQMFMLMQQVAQRLDLLNFFSYVMSIVPSEVPYMGGETYANFFWKFVPRILYPDKPVENWGHTFRPRVRFVGFIRHHDFREHAAISRVLH